MSEDNKRIRKITYRSVIIAVLALILVLALVIGFVNTILLVIDREPARRDVCYVGSLCLSEQSDKLTVERKTELVFSHTDEHGNKETSIYDYYYLRNDGDEAINLIIAYPVINLRENEAFEMTVNGVSNTRWYGACSKAQFSEDMQIHVVKNRLKDGNYFEMAFPNRQESGVPLMPESEGVSLQNYAVVYYACELTLEQYGAATMEISMDRAGMASVEFAPSCWDVICKDHYFSVDNIDLM